MKTIKIIVVLLSFPVLFNGCSKQDDDDCKGGTGGDLTIVAKTMHHTKLIPGCTLYVKYNTMEFPGEDPGKYDASYKIGDSASEISISGLQCGDYYFYATGIDSSLAVGNNIVKGGIPYSTDKKVGSVSITVPITEGD